MNQDEMIALAKQAGFAEPERIISTDTVRCVPDLAYFAELIKRPWVGLSEQDINELKFNLPDMYYWVDVVRATEKKLKEKNNA
jgi:hypothetical protein